MAAFDRLDPFAAGSLHFRLGEWSAATVNRNRISGGICALHSANPRCCRCFCQVAARRSERLPDTSPRSGDPGKLPASDAPRRQRIKQLPDTLGLSWWTLSRPGPGEFFTLAFGTGVEPVASRLTVWCSTLELTTFGWPSQPSLEPMHGTRNADRRNEATAPLAGLC
jgi:hypothetical protein